MFLLWFLCFVHVTSSKLKSNSTKVIYKIPTEDTMPPYGLHEGYREFKAEHWHHWNEDYRVINLGRDTFGNPIFQKVLEN